MPARQPFTGLCRTLAQPHGEQRVDLHVHSTHSDGAYSPAQIVDLARRSGLPAIALTDHDTTSGVAPARAVARPGLEIIAAVEISAEHLGHDLHLLGYFICLDYVPLNDALRRLRERRAERFREMVQRLRDRGIVFNEEHLPTASTEAAMGRRNLAMLLVQAGHCQSIQEAFARYLNCRGTVALPAPRLSAAEAIGLVRGAGGVATWAHPSYDECFPERLGQLTRLGLGALEVDYPTHPPGRVRKLREFAVAHGLAVSGGSDCHGPDEPRRAIGTRGISRDELERLRQRAGATR